jgi:hypothetical protein
MASADFCPITPHRLLGGALRLLARALPGSLTRGGSTPVRLDLDQPVAQLVIHDANLHRHVGQISPNKNMSFQCATAAFTLSAGPEGLRHLVLTRPRTEPSMQFVFLGSHLFARASFGQILTDLPLPSATRHFESKLIKWHKLIRDHSAMEVSACK